MDGGAYAVWQHAKDDKNDHNPNLGPAGSKAMTNWRASFGRADGLLQIMVSQSAQIVSCIQLANA